MVTACALQYRMLGQAHRNQAVGCPSRTYAMPSSLADPSLCSCLLGAWCVALTSSRWKALIASIQYAILWLVWLRAPTNAVLTHFLACHEQAKESHCWIYTISSLVTGPVLTMTKCFAIWPVVGNLWNAHAPAKALTFLLSGQLYGWSSRVRHEIHL